MNGGWQWAGGVGAVGGGKEVGARVHGQKQGYSPCWQEGTIHSLNGYECNGGMHVRGVTVLEGWAGAKVGRHNVASTVRWGMFTLRNAAGAREPRMAVW